MSYATLSQTAAQARCRLAHPQAPSTPPHDVHGGIALATSIHYSLAALLKDVAELALRDNHGVRALGRIRS
jgi:hypothetical protein